MLGVARIFFYIFTIFSVTVTWILSAVFLAKTESTVNAYYNGNVLLLVFGAMAMLVLPILAFLGTAKRRKDVAGVTIAEGIIIFIFWALFLSGASKFSSEYNGEFSWDFVCSYFSYCGIGRSTLAWAWISFGFLTALFVIALAHGMFDYEGKKEKEREETAAKDGLVPLASNDSRGAAANEGGAGEKEEASTLPPPVPPVK